jgi:hypothetical protein
LRQRRKNATADAPAMGAFIYATAMTERDKEEALKFIIGTKYLRI